MDPVMQKMFEDAKNREMAKIDKPAKAENTWKPDPRFVEFKAGNTYKFRLLLTSGIDRKDPWIVKQTHTFVGKDGYNWVTCPTSDYLGGETRENFKACPICTENNKLYAAYQKGSKSSFELYCKLRRKFNMFTPVYVITDPVNKENENKVKLGRFGKTIHKFLMREVYGIDLDAKKTAPNEPEKWKVDPKDIVGIQAFDLNDGFDFVVTVSEEKIKNDDGSTTTKAKYSTKFAQKPYPINVAQTDIEKQVAELNLDKDYYTKSTKEDLLKFVAVNILAAQQDEEAEDNHEDTTTPHQVDVPQSEVKIESKSVDDIIKDITGG